MKKVLILLFVVFNFLNSQVLDRSLKTANISNTKIKIASNAKGKIK